MAVWVREGLLRDFLNSRVVDALHKKALYQGWRAEGKTTTMLAFIALTRPSDPIIVTATARHRDNMRRAWFEKFNNFFAPRFYLADDLRGRSGTLFTDECWLPDYLYLGPGSPLVYGGGVISSGMFERI